MRLGVVRRAKDQKLEELTRSSLLGRLGPSQLAAVGRAGEVIDVEAGTVLEEAGQRRAQWWLILEGIVVVDGPEGTWIAGPDDWWGVADALGGRPTGATVCALDRTRCLAVEARQLRGLLTSVPELGVGLLCR